MTPLKIIFMGTPEFAVPSLQALFESPHSVIAVYTQPPRPAGRGQKEMLTPVHRLALEKNIPVYNPVTLKDPETQKRFRDHKADVAVVAAYGLLLPRTILEATKMGCINVHPSLLPRWRGAAPIGRTIMAGDKETAVVIMQMDAGLDTGDMLMVKHYPIADGTNAGALHDALSHFSTPLLLATLDGLQKNVITPIKQSDEGITYAHKITKEECKIDWNESAFTIRQKILGLSPKPGAYFEYKNEMIKILDANFDTSSSGASSGTVLDNQFTIKCGEGIIRPLLLQRPSKKPIPIDEFLRGFPITLHTNLLSSLSPEPDPL
jgi:methionyl-tRNA formyltransferase